MSIENITPSRLYQRFPWLLEFEKDIGKAPLLLNVQTCTPETLSTWCGVRRNGVEELEVQGYFFDAKGVSLGKIHPVPSVKDALKRLLAKSVEYGNTISDSASRSPSLFKIRYVLILERKSPLQTKSDRYVTLYVLPGGTSMFNLIEHRIDNQFEVVRAKLSKVQKDVASICA